MELVGRGIIPELPCLGRGSHFRSRMFGCLHVLVADRFETIQKVITVAVLTINARPRCSCLGQ